MAFKILSLVIVNTFTIKSKLKFKEISTILYNSLNFLGSYFSLHLFAFSTASLERVHISSGSFSNLQFLLILRLIRFWRLPIYLGNSLKLLFVKLRFWSLIRLNRESGSSDILFWSRSRLIRFSKTNIYFGT